MRSNKYVAQATGLSRRAADAAIADGRVTINGQVAALGDQIDNHDTVMLDGAPLTLATTRTLMLNKPVGYVVSREGQGSKTIYELLPPELHDLKPIGRLDKDSSGLLLLTNDGDQANELTHPKFAKRKIYQVRLNGPLQPLHRQLIHDYGVQLEDGRSQLSLERLIEGDDTQWIVTMQEGRNRQIRRTFAALGYEVSGLHRTHFGNYVLDGLESGKYQPI